MTGTVGKLLLLCACGAAGWERGRRRLRRAACLRQFQRELAAMERDMMFAGLPVAGLLRKASESGGEAAAFFAACREDFIGSGCASLADSWRRASDRTELPLEPSDRALLAGAGGILGRYDGETQSRAMEGLQRQLASAAEEAEEEAKRLFRVDAALGITAGLFLVLLL